MLLYVCTPLKTDMYFVRVSVCLFVRLDVWLRVLLRNISLVIRVVCSFVFLRVCLYVCLSIRSTWLRYVCVCND